MVVTFILLGLCFGLARAQNANIPCQDLDTQSCEGFYKAKPDICDDPSVSHSMCKRLCGNCPLECYSCPSPVADPKDCTNVTQCGANMKCVTKHLRAIDGHHEYLMRCEKNEVCDLLMDGLGKRDISDVDGLNAEDRDRFERDVILNCCDKNLCNVEAQTTTTTTTTVKPTTSTTTTTTIAKPTTSTTTTTTTAKPTTSTTTTTTTTVKLTTTTHKPNTTYVAHSCHRDVVFVIPTPHLSNQNYWLSFIDQIVLQLPVEATSQVQVALVTSLDVQWYLNTYHSQVEVINAVEKLKHTRLYTGDGIGSTSAVLYVVTSRVLDSTQGDRRTAGNVVVVLENDSTSDSFLSTVVAANQLHLESNDVITVSVGTKIDTGNLQAIATNIHHVFTAPSFQVLPGLVQSVLKTICP